MFFDATTYLLGKDTLTIISDKITYNDDGNSLTASGNVKIKYGDYQLSTPELTYNKKTKVLNASKPIILKDKNSLKISAKSAEINDNFERVIASHASALIENRFYIE